MCMLFGMCCLLKASITTVLTTSKVTNAIKSAAATDKARAAVGPKATYTNPRKTEKLITMPMV